MYKMHPHSSDKSYKNASYYRHFFFGLFLIVSLSSVFLIVHVFLSSSDPYKYTKRNLNFDISPTKQEDEAVLKARNAKCTHWDCFNINRCGHTGHDRISVYVYPFDKQLHDSAISKEYHAILESVTKSKYYTTNPKEACIFIPPIDTLNIDIKRLNKTSRHLSSLPYWNNGENHLIFNMLSSGGYSETPAVLNLDIGSAMIAGAASDTLTFRTRFDVSIPMFSPISYLAKSTEKLNHTRKWWVTFSQLGVDAYYIEELQKLPFRDKILILDICQDYNYTTRCDIIYEKVYDYPAVLKESTFCLIFRGDPVSQFVVSEAMAAGCIPVFLVSELVLPFSNVIDWKRAAVFVMDDYLSTLGEVLGKISDKRINQMQKNVKFLYDAYFSNVEKIAMTTLDIIQDRIYSHWSKTYEDWNLPAEEKLTNPFILPLTSPKSHGFTAVILTYDRVESLFLLVQRLAKVPSLMKIIVVWNNQYKRPPLNFPQVAKPLKVIQTSANKLSNRFYPYKEIETEAILHIDDDIIMLNSDELEFGYEVWREFPDRIVGFPSRIHVWDNHTKSWKYESEWTNEISMVLTGAAFLHKYWSYVYTTKLTPEIKDWVDTNMNCEDIAMNFLIANITKQPPIKVTPRKKFKCPECTNNEMLSADIGHMVERSQCVDRFARIFGHMPLQTVEFRADPVLFKDVFPEKLKRFNEIGSL